MAARRARVPRRQADQVTTFNGFGDKLRASARALPDAQRSGVAEGALFVTQTIRHQPGYTTFLHGVGAKGAKVSVRYDVLTRGQAAIVYARGPFHLVERDTKPHEIRPKRRGRRGKRALTTPYGPRARVEHPGTKGRHPFEHGVDIARPAVTRIVHTGITRAISRKF